LCSEASAVQNSVYLAIFGSDGTATFAAWKGCLLTLIIDDTLCNRFFQMRMLVPYAAEDGRCNEVMEIRDAKGDLVESVTLAFPQPLSHDGAVQSIGQSGLLSEKMVHRVVNEDPEEWFTWRPETI